MVTDNTIEIKLEGMVHGSSLISVRSFAQTASKFDELLRQVQRAVLPNQRVNWTIHGLRTSSAVMEISGLSKDLNPSSVGHIVNQTVSALRAFETPDQSIPPWITPAVVHTVSQLSTITSRGRFTVRGQGVVVEVTQATAERAKALEEKRYHSLGSVEGRIESVSVHDGLTFHVYEALDNYRIVCSCSQDQWNQAHKNIGKRVRVIGQMVRRFDGKIESLQPESIRVYPEQSALPTAGDIMGIYEGNPASDDAERQR